MKIRKIYEPKLRFTPSINKEVDVNMSFAELIANMNYDTAIYSIKILKKKWGISYQHIAGIMGISPSAIKIAIKNDTFEYVVKQEKVLFGILELQYFYLQDTYFEIEVEDTEKEVEA